MQPPTAAPSSSAAASAGAVPEPPADRKTHRDVHRAALADLVKLSTESAAAERDIEVRLRNSTGAADKKAAETEAELAARLAAAQEQARQQHDDGVAQITADYQLQSASLADAHKLNSDRVEADHESLEGDVKQKRDQAVWLAESVFEAAQNAVQAERQKSDEGNRTHLEAIADLEKKADELLELYGTRPPAVDVEPAPAESPQAARSADELKELKETFAAHKEAAEHHLVSLQVLFLPKLFVGFRPYAIALFALAVAAVVGQFVAAPRTGATGTQFVPQFRAMGVAMGGTLAGGLLLGVGLYFLAKRGVRNAYVPFKRAAVEARRAAKTRLAAIERQQNTKYARAQRHRDNEVQVIRSKYAPMLSRAAQNREAALRTAQSEYDMKLARLEATRDAALAETRAWLEQTLSDLQSGYDADLQAARDKRAAETAAARQRHDDAFAALEKRWNDGLRRIQAPIDEGADGQVVERQPTRWDDAGWRDWQPPRRFASSARFGELRVDLPQITEHVPQKLALPPEFSVPAALAFPRQASLLIHADHAGRAAALSTMQMVMTRLLTSLPPGRVRFTIIDPVGLGQNFAGFMHLADHDDALVGGRIWTEAEQIEQRLANLTEHMETVIQKYLRNEFETIDDYNAQAGELAEPYRFLVIADFPVAFQGEAYRRLASIASSGARCGVYTLIVRDTRTPLPAGAHLDEVVANSVNLVQTAPGAATFTWKDEVFQRFPLTIDEPPSEQFLTRMMDVVGRAAKAASRVEVPFETIAPKAGELWSLRSADDLQVPIGRLGATRLQMMRLGKGVAQHALIAGKTGSGKSTLLHAMITNLAMWYSPDEVEFYLVDFKKGVEFKTYATHDLPHARAIAVESDREFGLSVLQRIDAELTRRGQLFRELGVQDMAAYRRAANKPMPRTLLVIDEFQEFFSEDDKLAQEAGLLLDRLVRQGRAFGIHVLLGSQTIGGTSGLARSTIGQMAVRIALQTSEADSQLILGDNNSAARLLSRPGEAIYNDAGGLVEGNSPFQVAWLPDEQRERYLSIVQKKETERTGGGPNGHPLPIVFEGNAPADIRHNARLAMLLSNPPAKAPPAPLAWLGDPVAIKDPTSLAIRRQSGANALIVGQADESALAMLATSIVSLAAHHPVGGAVFYLLDGTPADSPFAGQLARVARAVPHETRNIEWRAVPDAVNGLARELEKRNAADHNPAHDPNVFVLIYGLQRFRVLRKADEDFSFSLSGGDDDGGGGKPPNTGKQFADLLRDGPPVGIHVLAWADTAVAVDRTLDRGSLREFDHRVLFQMSAADSSTLIDSPAANKLGFHRALAYSEEQGLMEKFRPYAVPDQAWLDRLRPAMTRTAPAAARA